MSKIAFKCSSCGHSLSVDAAYAGKKCKCPRCSKVILIPAAEAAEPASAGSAEGCPGCGRPVAPGQVICVNCGLNLKTGERMQAAVETTPPAVRGLGEGPVRKRYSIRSARGKGGRGKRIALGTPADIVLTPDEEDPEKRITFEGTQSVRGSWFKVLLYTILATAATYGILYLVAQNLGFCAGPGALVWYLIFSRMARATIVTSLHAKASARAVSDDRKSWISVEVSPREWVSFVPVKGMMPRPEETDEKAYETVKDTLGEVLGGNLESKR